MGQDNSEKRSGIEAVIVAPSRELGMQIVREVEKILGPNDKRLVQQLVGGANRSRQEEALKKNKPIIVVGTPGRISEISAAGKLHTHGCRFLVLDEVDQLLSFNYREDMHRILEHVGILAHLLGVLSAKLSWFLQQFHFQLYEQQGVGVMIQFLLELRV
jgi:superfamily II DNA/RNA helicase